MGNDERTKLLTRLIDSDFTGNSKLLKCTFLFKFTLVISLQCWNKLNITSNIHVLLLYQSQIRLNKTIKFICSKRINLKFFNLRLIKMEGFYWHVVEGSFSIDLSLYHLILSSEYQWRENIKPMINDNIFYRTSSNCFHQLQWTNYFLENSADPNTERTRTKLQHIF